MQKCIIFWGMDSMGANERESWLTIESSTLLRLVIVTHITSNILFCQVIEMKLHSFLFIFFLLGLWVDFFPLHHSHDKWKWPRGFGIWLLLNSHQILTAKHTPSPYSSLTTTKHLTQISAIISIQLSLSSSLVTDKNQWISLSSTSSSPTNDFTSNT